MEITLTNCEHIMRAQARGGLPTSYSIGTIQVVASNQEEIWEVLRAMQRWANGTFEPVVMERPDPEGPLIVTPLESKSPELGDIQIDPLTGFPI